MLEMRELTIDDLASIKELFRAVFTAPPWNDDWSDDQQLTDYLLDLMQVRTPVDLGLYEDGELVGLSLGNIRHWSEGTEYFIEEFCIKEDAQGRGLGTTFIKLIEKLVPSKGADTIFLFTERDVPAFNFYLHRGFQEAPEHVALFKVLGEDDAVDA